MLMNKSGKKIRIFAILLAVFVCALFAIAGTANPIASASTAQYVPYVTFASGSYTFLEAEEHNYIFLAADDEHIDDLIGLTIGYNVSAESTAEYSVNYSSVSEGTALMVCIDGTLAMRLDSIYNSGYDTGKKLSISLSSTDAAAYSIYGATTAEITFKDKNPDGYVAITSEDKTVYECDGTVTFTVQCSPNFFGTNVTFTYGGTAARGTDYTAPDSVYLPAGTSRTDVEITLIDNSEKSSFQKYIFVNLDTCSAGSEIAAIPNSTIITVNDDESIGVLSFISATDRVLEQDGEYALTVIRKGGTVGELHFRLTMTTNAVIGTNYVGDVSGEYVLYDGEASKTVRLKLREDEIYTGAYSFDFALSEVDGYTTEFDIRGMQLIREDSFYPSALYVDAPKVGGEYLYYIRQGSREYYADDEYYIDIMKTAGDNVSCRVEITMQDEDGNPVWREAGYSFRANMKAYDGSGAYETWDYTTNGKSYMITSDSYTACKIARIFFPYNLTSYYTGDTYFVIRIYDLSTGVTVCGEEGEAIVTVKAAETESNGVYALREATVSGDMVYIEAGADTISTEEVSGTVTVSQDGVTLAEYAIEFNQNISSFMTVFPLIGEGYNAITEGESITVTLSVGGTAQVAAGRGSKILSTRAGRGGTVGFGGVIGYWDTVKPYFHTEHSAMPHYTIVEGGNVTVTLFRTFGNGLTAIDVPLYITNASEYFDRAHPVATAHFAAGAMAATAIISLADLDGKLLSDENNYLYIGASAIGEYNVCTAPGQESMYYRVNEEYDYYQFVQLYSMATFTILDGDDYGKVGFADTNVTMDEGSSITLSLIKEGGINTPVEMYIVSTNLSILPTFNAVTLTSSGYSFDFEYDDDVWHDSFTNRGYITIGLRTPVGNTRVNSAGLIKNKETVTIYLNEDELLGYVGFCEDDSYTYINDAAYAIEIDEEHYNDMYVNVYVKVTDFYPAKEYSASGYFSYYIYTVAADGSETIAPCNMTSRQYYLSARIKVEASAENKDNVFCIYLGVSRSDTYVLQNCGKITVTVKDTMQVTYITVAQKQARASEKKGEISWTLFRNALNLGDKTLTVTGFSAVIDALSEYSDGVEMYIDEVKLTDGTFVWSKEKYYLTLTIKWLDDGDQNPARNNEVYSFSISAEQDQYCAVTWDGDINFTIYDDEVTGNVKWASSYNSNTEEENSYALQSPDGQPPYIAVNVDTSELKDMAYNFSVYYTVEALDDNARAFLGADTYSSSMWFGNGGIGVLKLYYSDFDYTYFESACFVITLTGNSINNTLPNNATRYFTYYSANAAFTVNDSGLNTLSSRSDSTYVTLARTSGLLHEVDVTFSLDEAAVAAGYYIEQDTLHIVAFDTDLHYVYIHSPSANNDITEIILTANYDTGNQSYSEEYTGTLRHSGVIYYEISAAKAVTEGEDVVFTVSRSGGNADGTVNYSVTGTDGRVIVASGSVEFAVGETVKTFTARTINNTVMDGNALVRAVISPSGGDLCRTSAAAVTLTDNDTMLSGMSESVFNETFVSYQIADMNNDTLKDVIGILPNGKVVVYYNDGVGFGVKKVSDTALSLNKDYIIKTGHVTADGAESVLVIYADKVAIIKGNGAITITDYTIQTLDLSLHIEVKDVSDSYPGDEIAFGGYCYHFSNSYFLQPQPDYSVYLSPAKTYKVTLQSGTVINNVIPVNISLNPKKQEYIASLDGSLYAVIYSETRGGYIMSDGIATGVESFSVSDLYGSGYHSVAYYSEGKVRIIQNFIGSSSFSVEKAEYYCTDTDPYVEITILREGMTVFEQTVGLSTADITAVSGEDYTALTELLIFAAGESRQSVRINLKDSSSTPNATLTFACTLLTDNPSINIAAAGRESIICIKDTDNSGEVSIGATQTFSEADGRVSVTLTRTQAAYDFTLDYTFEDRFLMENGVGYEGVNGTVTFGAGEYSKTITFDIIDDDIYNILENYALVVNRKFVIVLSNARSSYDYTNYSAYAPRFGNSEMQVTVTDDEQFAEKMQQAEGDVYEIRNIYDFDGDGRGDEYTVTDTSLSITLAAGYPDATSYVYSRSSLRTLYGSDLGSLSYCESTNTFVFYGSSGGRTFRVNSNGLTLTGDIVLSGGSGDIYNSPSYVGDFDGDGRADIAYFSYSYFNDMKTTVYYALSSEAYAVREVMQISERNAYNIAYTLSYCIVKDITGEGADDLLLCLSYASHNAYAYILNTGESAVYECILKNVSLMWDVSYGYYAVKINEGGEYALCLANVYNSPAAMAKNETSGLYDLRVYLYNGEKLVLDSNYYFGTPVQGSIGWTVAIDPETGYEYLQSSNGYTFKLQTALKALVLVAEDCSEKDGYTYLTINNYSGKADTVNYYFVDDSAINGRHYQCADGFVTFNAGETSKRVAVKLLDNSYYDAVKRFSVYITSANGQIVATGKVDVAIWDDESTALLLPQYSFYQAGRDFTYTVNSGYNIASFTTDSDGEMLCAVSGNTFTFNFAQSGNKKVTICGYDEQETLIFYQQITFTVLPADSLYVDVNIPGSIAGDSTLDITLRAYQAVRISYNGYAYYYLAGAQLTFINPFTMESVTVTADKSGTATYSLDVTGGDYGVYNLIFAGNSYLGAITERTVTTTVTNPDGEITGYVLLPDGNTGAGGIKVKIAGKTATTDNHGYFSIDVTSGFTYTAQINAGRANSFYEETTVTVQHNKLMSIISVCLTEIVENALTFQVSYFYNEYLSGTYRTEFDSKINSVSYAYDVTNYTYKYGSERLTMSNYFADSSELPAMTVNYPSSTARGKVDRVTRTFHNDGILSSSNYYTYSNSQLAGFNSRTELYFEFCSSNVNRVWDYLWDLEFIVCDSNGNTLRKLTNVDYDWLETYDAYSRYGDEARGIMNANTNSYEFDYFIKLTVKAGDVNEGEMLYIRRITSNDVMYYYTGITFGRSLAEKTRDDISAKFDAVKSESIANDLGFLADCVFGIDLYTVDNKMVKNSDGTVNVYLGYAATSYNLDVVPTTTKASGSLSVSQGSAEFSVSSSSEIGIYFGGIFRMRYNESLSAWEYESGKAMFQGYATNTTQISFSYSIVMGISVYVYTQFTTGFVSNIVVDVRDGVLVVNGNDEIAIEIKVGIGISLTLVKGEIWGTVGGQLKMYYGELQGTSMRVTFTGGMTAYVLWFEFTQRWFSVSFEYQNTYTPTVIEEVRETLSAITGSMGDAYAVEIDEAGVIQGDTSEVAALEEVTIVEQTIIGSTPTIVNYGTSKMLVYKQGVSYRGLSYQALFFKVLQGNTWSAASRVTSLVRNIGEFSVAVSGGVPMIAFTHTIADGNLASQMQYVDVSVAIFSVERRTFEVQEITADNLPDANPLLIAGGGHVMLIFDKTYRNDYSMDMTLASVLFNDRALNYKMYSIFDGTSFTQPEIFVRGAYNTIDEEGAIIGDSLYYSVIADMDGDVTTESDTEVLCWTYDYESGVWSNYVNITNNAFAETQLEIVVQNDKAIFIWLNKYGINYSVAGGVSSVINTYEHGDISYFEVTSYGNNVVIAWTENTVNIEEQSSNYVYFLVIDGSGNVGRRKALIGTDGIIISYALAATDDEVYAVYCMSAYDDTLTSANVYSIASVRVPFVTNAAAENIFTATGRWRAGEEETVYFDVTNYGHYLLNNVAVTVRANNQSGAVLYTANISSLKMGETKTLSFSTVITEGLYGVFITLEQGGATPSPISLKRFCAVTLLVNDSSSITDVSFSMQNEAITFDALNVICQNNTVKVIASIDNLGDVATCGVIKLYVIKDYVSTLIMTKEFALSYGENADILMEIATAVLREYQTDTGMLSFAAHIESATAEIVNFAESSSVMFSERFAVTLKSGRNSTVEYNETGSLSQVTAPKKAGFNFGGWYLDEALTIEAQFPLELTDDITLYAKWTVKPGLVVGLSVGGALLLIGGAIVLYLYLRKNKRYEIVLMKVRGFLQSANKALKKICKRICGFFVLAAQWIKKIFYKLFKPKQAKNSDKDAGLPAQEAKEQTEQAPKQETPADGCAEESTLEEKQRAYSIPNENALADGCDTDSTPKGKAINESHREKIGEEQGAPTESAQTKSAQREDGVAKNAENEEENEND